MRKNELTHRNMTATMSNSAPIDNKTADTQKQLGEIGKMLGTSGVDDRGTEGPKLSYDAMEIQKLSSALPSSLVGAFGQKKKHDATPGKPIQKPGNHSTGQTEMQQLSSAMPSGLAGAFGGKKSGNIGKSSTHSDKNSRKVKEQMEDSDGHESESQDLEDFSSGSGGASYDSNPEDGVKITASKRREASSGRRRDPNKPHSRGEATRKKRSPHGSPRRVVTDGKTEKRRGSPHRNHNRAVTDGPVEKGRRREAKSNSEKVPVRKTRSLKGEGSPTRNTEKRRVRETQSLKEKESPPGGRHRSRAEGRRGEEAKSGPRGRRTRSGGRNIKNLAQAQVAQAIQNNDKEIAQTAAMDAEFLEQALREEEERRRQDEEAAAQEEEEEAALEEAKKTPAAASQYAPTKLAGLALTAAGAVASTAGSAAKTTASSGLNIATKASALAGNTAKTTASSGFSIATKATSLVSTVATTAGSTALNVASTAGNTAKSVASSTANVAASAVLTTRGTAHVAAGEDESDDGLGEMI